MSHILINISDVNGKHQNIAIMTHLPFWITSSLLQEDADIYALHRKYFYLFTHHCGREVTY